MRIISQNGEWDIQYEHVTVQRFEKDIYFLNKNLTGIESLVDDVKIASYSTEENAKKAMKMLHDKYLSRTELDGGYDQMNNCYVQPVFWVPPKVFQFPSDEDLKNCFK